jgi:DNA-binding LacI/PurR family transcriptional regulator
MSSTGRPTLQEVATLAGVSMGTASSVFSQRQAVADHTRAAVLRAAAELGYRPRRRLGALDVRGLTTIGLLARPANYPGPANQYAATVFQGVQQAAADLGLTVVYELMPPADGGAGLPMMVQRAEVQGLVILGDIDARVLTRLLRARLPCVLVDHTVDEPSVDSVRADDRKGGLLATDHLLKLGHRSPVPALIVGPSDHGPSRDRAAGYRAALAASGLKLQPAYVRQLGSMDMAGGRAAMRDLLGLPHPPTAVFCGNDTTAVGALQLLRERRLPVPRRVSVVGYDDIDLTTTTSPALTTVRVDKHLLGAQGVWHLVQRIRQPHLPRRITYADVQLTVRASTGPVPR